MLVYYKEHRKVFFIFLVLVFLFYGNSLKNKYALDDEYITVTNFKEKGKQYFPNHKLVSLGFKGIIDIWQSTYAHDAEASFEYRPVTTTTFAIEYGIFGQNPFVSHFINLLLYLFTIWLLFCILLKLFEDYENKLDIAFLISILFLIHPIHTEVVNNIKCRDEQFAMFFPLISFWHSFSFFKKPTFKNILLISLFMLLGFLSKKSALIFIAIIPLSFILFKKVNLKLIIVSVLLLFLSYVPFLAIKNNLLKEKYVRNFYDFENPLYVLKVSFFTKIIIALKSLGFYLKLFFLPFPLRFYYGNNIIDITGGLDIYFFISILFFILCTFYYFNTKNKIFLLGVLVFLIGIFPFLNFVIPVPGVFGERLSYISSIGFCILIISLIIPFIKTINWFNFDNLWSKPKIYFVLIILLCFVYTVNRNNNWYNKLSLFEHDIQKLEKSSKANSLLANEYFEMLQSSNKKYSDQITLQKAINHYSQAVKNDSSFFSAYNNVGVIYYSYLKDYTTAKKLFSLAIRHKPKYSQAYENLGNCYKIEKNLHKAIWCYKKSFEIDPKQYSAYINAITFLFDSRKFTECLEIIELAKRNFPNNYELIAQEANCYLMNNDVKKALSKYEEAYKLNPNKNLSNFLFKKFNEIGDTLKANTFSNI